MGMYESYLTSPSFRLSLTLAGAVTTCCCCNQTAGDECHLAAYGSQFPFRNPWHMFSAPERTFDTLAANLRLHTSFHIPLPLPQALVQPSCLLLPQRTQQIPNPKPQRPHRPLIPLQAYLRGTLYMLCPVATRMTLVLSNRVTPEALHHMCRDLAWWSRLREVGVVAMRPCGTGLFGPGLSTTALEGLSALLGLRVSGMWLGHVPAVPYGIRGRSTVAGDSGMPLLGRLWGRRAVLAADSVGLCTAALCVRRLQGRDFA